MTDTTRDPFEVRLAAALHDYVAAAHDPRPASTIADAAMRPRGLATRLMRGGSRSRRLLLLGMAAVLLAPTAYFGARLLLPPAPAPSPVVDDHVPSGNWRAIVIRRTFVDPGVAVFATAADGSEKLLRQISDSVLPAGNTFSEWGSVSETGWIALSEQARPWNMVLVDLRDQNSEPWIVPGTSLGGVGPAWGPQGLIAAPFDLSNAWIFDPETRATVKTLHGGLIGGGPSIIWTEDGSGLVDESQSGTYGTLPIDGGPFIPGFPAIFGTRAGFGDLGQTLRICQAGLDGGCPTTDGRVELVNAAGQAQTIWEQSGTDRASASIFGDKAGEYLIQVDGDGGREVGVLRVSNGRITKVVSFSRPLNWHYYFVAGLSPDESMATYVVDLGNDIYGTVFAPSSGGAPTYHHAQFGGYLAASIADGIGTTPYDPESGEALGGGSQSPYPLASVEELIAAAEALNPGHVAVGQNSANAVDGDGTMQQYQLTATVSGNLELWVDCFGAHPVTVTFGTSLTTNPCTTTGSYGNVLVMNAGDTATITASHDTTWRVVLYATDPAQFEGSPPPVPMPVDTPAATGG